MQLRVLNKKVSTWGNRATCRLTSVWLHNRVPPGAGMRIITLYSYIYTTNACIYLDCTYFIESTGITLLSLLLLLCVAYSAVVAATTCYCCSSSCAGCAKFVAGSLSLILSSVFFALKNDLFLFTPKGSSFTASICLYYVHPRYSNCGHARSQGGRRPPAAKSTVYMFYPVSCKK